VRVKAASDKGERDVSYITVEFAQEEISIFCGAICQQCGAELNMCQVDGGKTYATIEVAPCPVCLRQVAEEEG
jgi:hypothetical protein